MVKMQGGVFGAVATLGRADRGARMSERSLRRPSHRRPSGRPARIGVETVGIGKRFGDLVALDDVSVRVRRGHGPCAPGRERRRQVDAGQMHHGLLPARRGQRHDRRARDRDREPAPGAGAWARHGLSAFHAGAAHDRAREHGHGARRRAGGHRLARRSGSGSPPSSTTMPFTRAARRAGRRARRRREAEGSKC